LENKATTSSKFLKSIFVPLFFVAGLIL